VARIVLQRAEEILPAVIESMVSVLCSCAQKRICHMSVVLFKETKYFVTGFDLAFIMHLGSILQIVVDAVTVCYVI
jgi:hypothetical protein